MSEMKINGESFDTLVAQLRQQVNAVVDERSLQKMQREFSKMSVDSQRRIGDLFYIYVALLRLLASGADHADLRAMFTELHNKIGKYIMQATEVSYSNEETPTVNCPPIGGRN